jgi:hypothetical protein
LLQRNRINGCCSGLTVANCSTSAEGRTREHRRTLHPNQPTVDAKLAEGATEATSRLFSLPIIVPRIPFLILNSKAKTFEVQPFWPQSRLTPFSSSFCTISCSEEIASVPQSCNYPLTSVLLVIILCSKGFAVTERLTIVW